MLFGGGPGAVEIATTGKDICAQMTSAKSTVEIVMQKAKTPHALLYLAAFTIFSLVWQSFHDIGLSTMLTFSVLIQVVALSALLLALALRRSVAGLSVKSIQMQGLSFVLRLCCTTWLRGYIPVDSTGDWLYQLADFTAVILCCQVVYLAKIRFRTTYDESADSFEIRGLLIMCAVLAAIVHPELNNRPFFDALWACSLYVDVVSTLPQLHIMSKCRGRTVDSLNAHYVALSVISRVMDMIFWWHGYTELAPEDGGFNTAGYAIMASHLLHLLLNGDFAYCYIRSILAGSILDRHLDFSSGLHDIV